MVPIMPARCTRPVVRDSVATNRASALPAGACDRHGSVPVRPIDTIAAGGLWRRAATRLGARAAVALRGPPAHPLAMLASSLDSVRR